MKTIGLLGGMSWESTALYYERVNRRVRDRLGGLHSAEIVLRSVDFAEIAAMQEAGDWEAAGERLAHEARVLEGAGADLLVLCTNTMHVVADAIEAATTLPLLHLADATGRRVRDADVRTVALLGTRYTMEMPFYRERLEDRFGLRVRVPDEPGRALLQRVIFEELCLGEVRPASQAAVADLVRRLAADGAEGAIEGCTEIGMLRLHERLDLPLFDTTAIHADAAADAAMDGATFSRP